MKLFVTILGLCLLAICYSFPIENEYKNTLDAVDIAVQSDDNVEHARLTRGYRGYGGYGGYEGYYGGYAGYGGYGGYHGGYGGYPGAYGGYPLGGFGGASASASASASSFGGGFF